MAVRLRLMRMGKKKQPTYRVVAADSRSPRNGRFIEIVGTYQPRLDPSVVKIDNDRAVHWLQQGAQPSEAVEKLLKISGAWADFKGEEFVPSVPPAPKAKPVVQQPEPSSGEVQNDTSADETEESTPQANVDEAEANVDEAEANEVEATEEPSEDEAEQEVNVDDEEQT
ncbi:MAG TPA: 30S ribosomal protein S16 [Acidimicrobiia bacterium]|nr:30S ribosomal protein S16 [Acidimicrobiia bacterium]HIL06230.1 30S ribosomal protein S16 [Acidimicrobiia bacterium]